jgi:hypothetical protein
MTTTDYDQVLALIRQLDPGERDRLVAEVAAMRPPVAPTLRPKLTPEQARLLGAQLREDFRARGPTSPTMAEQLAADRRARDRALMGRAADRADEDEDVHA